ncbi:hypothetical protein PMIN05_000872 [Paraphaeosphaeria minitans]
MLDTDKSITDEPFRPFYNFWTPKPVLVHQDNEYDGDAFIERPWLGVLLFDNNASDARDHAANERTFLSWLRLSIYMAIVAVAIILNFHLKSEPTAVGECNPNWWSERISHFFGSTVPRCWDALRLGHCQSVEISDLDRQNGESRFPSVSFSGSYR